MIALGGGFAAAGLVTELIQGLSEMGRGCFLNLFERCIESPGPPESVGFVGLGLIAVGATVMLVSIPLWKAPSHPTALVTPTGAGLRFSF